MADSNNVVNGETKMDVDSFEAPVLACFSCHRKSSNTQWNCYDVYKRSTGDVRVPVKDICAPCALGATLGQFGTFAQVREKCSADKGFGEQLWAAGAMAKARGITEREKFPQEATDGVTSTKVRVQQFARMTDEAGVKEHFGKTPEQLGISKWEFDGQFGKKVGYVIEDTSKEPVITFEIEIGSELRVAKMNPSRQIRAGQGTDAFNNGVLTDRNTFPAYSAAHLENKVSEINKQELEAQVARAEAGAAPPIATGNTGVAEAAERVVEVGMSLDEDEGWDADAPSKKRAKKGEGKGAGRNKGGKAKGGGRGKAPASSAAARAAPA
eukprot:9486033-Pyramimonas_sp.AAC.1